eukprot:CAMPEP_0172374748 /NCGR_PEP_ID=MMETSP1060-20121228/57324_1 /TAXON_ID=37318 /ORGANISM="Pseudo-nitzschia pungens, Strain cf. cingulata" /LENGTH=275 /DNA_ID=CAMNT_0013101547 /DNA_START=208 /DNA_END=1035 /DNA_ORIENTATION=+
MGQIDQRVTLSPRFRGGMSKESLFRIDCASKCHSRRIAVSKNPNTSRVVPGFVDNESVDHKEERDSRVHSNIHTSCHLNTKTNPSNTMLRSGVYFNNSEVLNTIHPAQVSHVKGEVIKVLNLPVGMPLAKPPRLGSFYKGVLPPITENITDMKTLRRKEVVRQFKEKIQERKKRREKEGSKHEKPEGKPLKRIRIENTAFHSSSGNSLSSEERLFFEAAVALSSSEVPTSTNGKRNEPRQVSLEPAGQTTTSRPPRYSLYLGSASKMLLPLRPKS